MKYIPFILLLVLQLNYAANVKLQKNSLTKDNGQVELNVQSDENILGIQFDMHYNIDELKFNGAISIPDHFIFEFSEKENGLIRGIMFSMEGEILNQMNVESLISFDFEPVEYFIGSSVLEFTDVFIAGYNG